MQVSERWVVEVRTAIIVIYVVGGGKSIKKTVFVPIDPPHGVCSWKLKKNEMSEDFQKNSKAYRKQHPLLPIGRPLGVHSGVPSGTSSYPDHQALSGSKTISLQESSQPYTIKYLERSRCVCKRTEGKKEDNFMTLSVLHSVYLSFPRNARSYVSESYTHPFIRIQYPSKALRSDGSACGRLYLLGQVARMKIMFTRPCCHRTTAVQSRISDLWERDFVLSGDIAMRWFQEAS